ncbi:uncharacterized protein KY384_004187 [Bacidia gigantensis]|uniref:uncharacterized protein n=1 Tax=Bacidia gigantensis TaxID=2732470 RepID=UPI001D041FEB|nr:uncharacterized protein KY384_004187 [Bacidia gigantensis]KAG8530830.1 hypothetical protein KY384_004187 [Bacidia gigantensis]
MGTPSDELPPPQFTHPNYSNNGVFDSDDEGTLSNEYDRPERVPTIDQQGFLGGKTSHSQSKEQEIRLEDDLAMLQAERVVSRSQSHGPEGLHRSTTVHRSRSRPEPIDQFDVNTNPIHEKTSGFRPPENPTGRVAKTFKRIHDASFLVRYFCYIVPIVVLILIPLLLGALVFRKSTVGGVRLLWFCVWLEIVWLTLWAGRILAQALPWPVGLLSSLATNNDKKWRDMCKQLELPATLFFWQLGVLISFLPVMIHHHLEGGPKMLHWEGVMNKVLVSIFVGATINFAEKIIIQLIAISFHLRTYADRIDINKFQIGSLTKLYEYSKEKIAMEDSDFEEHTPLAPGSGTRTPMQMLDQAQKKTRSAFGKVGDAAGKVAGDFTGKAVTKSTHPCQLVLLLLSSPQQSQVLARRLYRTFAPDDAETITAEELKNAFDNDEEADSAFAMFDKDMNGDISMTELEAVCVEIGKERKAITASLKDLDSVVAKLDAVLSFFVFVATVLVLISLISTSAAGVLTSAGSAVLALSWLLSQTAQEFLASCIFVLVKHPFDVGDRVTIYGNTGTLGKGDDYFVKEISLLYTEFKKLEGQIVQAPNSYLNTLFILNMRRSGGLAEAVTLTVKFGTTIDQIDELRSRLLEYVKSEKREYQPNILTEIREVVEVHEVNLNVIFFYKSNWQNELLRLQRRNKFICAMMICMQEIGIEGPRRRIPGAKDDTPFYYTHSGGHSTDFPSTASGNGRGNMSMEAGSGPFSPSRSQETGSIQDSGNSINRNRSIMRPQGAGRRRDESVSAMGKRVDFSLGMKDVSSADLMDDFSENIQPKLPNMRRSSASRARDARDRIIEEDDAQRTRQSKEGGRFSIDRSTSRASGSRSRFGVRRAETAGSTASHGHRNRFFSRSKQRGDNHDEEEGFIQQPMADIPELPRSAATRTDARMVSPLAIRPSNDTGFSSLQLSGGPVQPTSSNGGGGAGPAAFNDRMHLTHPAERDIHAQDFEMRRLT